MTNRLEPAVVQLGILASGAGTTTQYLIDAITSKQLENVQVAAIISNNSTAGVLNIAADHKIKHYHISSRTHPHNEFQRIGDAFAAHQVNLILAAGYMKKIEPVLFNRFFTVNTHPSLLPKYGGQGMYGNRVHMAVAQAGEKVSGVTIHQVNGEYDRGAIELQMKVAVPQCKTTEQTAVELENVVKLQEKIMLVDYLRKYAMNQLSS